MLWPVVMEVSTISFVVTYVSDYHHTYSITKRSYRRTHTQSTCYTTHECFQTLCCYSPQWAKIEKNAIWKCNIFVFWNFFRTLLKKTYSRNVYFKFFFSFEAKTVYYLGCVFPNSHFFFCVWAHCVLLRLLVVVVLSQINV